MRLAEQSKYILEKYVLKHLFRCNVSNVESWQEAD